MTELRAIGGSALKTPPLILGGNVFGWTADRETSFAILDAFVAGGGRMIDTADVYSAWVPGHQGGESERLIGDWMKLRGRRNDLLIATKLGMMPGEGGEGLAPARIAAAIDGSLARLQTDHVDVYFAHRDDESQDQAAVADAFDRLVQAGKVRVIGASNFSAERLGSAVAGQREAGKARYQVLQNQYNLLERDGYEGAVQDVCVENGIGMTPFYGLASGYLTGKYRTAEDYKGVRSDATRKYAEGKGPRVLKALDTIAGETGASLAQISLAWIARQPGIVAPIASATSVKQTEDLLGALSLDLTDDQLAALDEASGPG